MYREQKARRLEARSREIEEQRREAFRKSAHERRTAESDTFATELETYDWWNPALSPDPTASAAARWLRANVARYKLRTPPRAYSPGKAERTAKGRPVKGTETSKLAPRGDAPWAEPRELVCARCEHTWEPVKAVIPDAETYTDPVTGDVRFRAPFGRSASPTFFNPTQREHPDHTCPNCGTEPTRAELEGSPWHLSRAGGARTVFERIRACPTDPRRLVQTCRNSECRERYEIKIGCDSQMFCQSCRARRAQDFRHDFNRKRLGLMNSARLGGLRSRSLDRQARRIAKEDLKARFRERAHRLMRGQPLAELTEPPQLRDWREYSKRMGERMLTFTTPSEGTPEERIDVLQKTWARFWRLFRQYYRPQFDNIPTKLREDLSDEDEQRRVKASPGIGYDPKTGEILPHGKTLSMWDLFHYLWVLEWTPGEKDPLGNPHLHVWLFSTYIPHHVLRSLASRAYAEVTNQTEVCPLLVLDIRAPDLGRSEFEDKIDSELVKYLTKDWAEPGAKPVSPAVFARVYKRLDGCRRRQTSAGLSNWALREHQACPCCFHESSPFNHWAYTTIENPMHVRAVEPAALLVFPDLGGTGPPLAKTRGAELYEEHQANKDAEWENSAERRQLARFMAFAVSST